MAGDPLSIELDAAKEKLSELFGSYKAEWLKDRVFDLFTEPAYFPELLTNRPCVLIGGRGTGKTTVLRCLAARQREHADTPNNPKYIGFYHCINTNRVAALKGSETTEEHWSKLFTHYFNLEIGEQVFRYLVEETAFASVELTPNDCSLLAEAFSLPPCESAAALLQATIRARIKLSKDVNSIADGLPGNLSSSMALDTAFECLASKSRFENTSFFVVLDEYENFLDYQQRIVNGFIKHARTSYTYKIGVRELGWRVRSTTNEHEQLISPADYVRIDIAERLPPPEFSVFASRVCGERLKHAESLTSLSIREMFPELSPDSEGALLGAGERADRIRSQNPTAGMQSLSDLETCFVAYWAESKEWTIEDVLSEREELGAAWTTRFETYKTPLLFTLRRGKPGIRKYYCGWETLVHISGSNIRYLLELVERSLLVHLESSPTLPLDSPVSAASQTRAAQAVGKKNLSELEGLTVEGARLVKLLLGLGRVFGILAEQPEGHTPEVTQFTLEESSPEVDQLLAAAVMHLALIRYSGSKPQGLGETKDYDYCVHPIFAPFFAFSHRRKRKLKLKPIQISGILTKPKDTIREIIKEQGRQEVAEMPDQLALFGGFYGS
jgi:hypothetical protein